MDNTNIIVLCSHIGVGIVADGDVLGLGVGLLLPLDVDDLVLGEQSVTHPVKRHPPGSGQQDKKSKGYDKLCPNDSHLPSNVCSLM